LAAGTYTLTAYVDTRAGGTPSAIIDLLAGGNIVGTTTSSVPGTDTWELVTLTAVISGTNAYLNDALGIELAASGNTVDFVDVGLSFVASALPLPAALPLFAMGLGGLTLLGWRRKKPKNVGYLSS
jgi:hypothetical protein